MAILTSELRLVAWLWPGGGHTPTMATAIVVVVFIVLSYALIRWLYR